MTLDEMRWIDLPGGYYLYQIRPSDMTCSLHMPDGLHIGNLRSEYAGDFAEAVRALAAADGVRDQMGASPTGPGWSDKPEPVPVSAASGDHPSRGRLADGCCSAVSPCSHQMRSPYTICEICAKAHQIGGGRMSDADAASVVRRLEGELGVKGPAAVLRAALGAARKAAASAIEAGTAETEGLGAKRESAAGEAGTPHLEIVHCSASAAKHIAQIAQERDAARAEVERLSAEHARMVCLVEAYRRGDVATSALTPPPPDPAV